MRAWNAFWKLPSGDEWGWQAKFFPGPPDTSQWSQIDGSVEKALEKHPRLTRCTICLPVNRADPRIAGQDWSMDKWNAHQDRWRKWAEEKGMSVEFPYWGESEIFSRMTREEHRGRYLFWFNRELFSECWFQNNIEEAIANAADRYQPDLNVELPLAELFDGLGRTDSFFVAIKVLHGELTRAFSEVAKTRLGAIATTELGRLTAVATDLLPELRKAEESEFNPIDLDNLEKLVSHSAALEYQCELAATQAERSGAAPVATSGPSHQPQHPNLGGIRREDLQWVRYYLYQLRRQLSDLASLICGEKARLANVGVLLLVGDAGTGKTHLFCQIARQRIDSKLPTVLILGEQFEVSEPWAQITTLLSLAHHDKEELLGALDAAAQAKGRTRGAPRQ